MIALKLRLLNAFLLLNTSKVFNENHAAKRGCFSMSAVIVLIY